MSFIVYDIILLVIFIIFLGRFLYIRKKNIHKQGLLLLYRADWGKKLIDKVGNKYKRTLGILSHVSVWLGYVLMAMMLYLVYTILKLYLFHPEVVEQIGVPPIMPLIPYIDKFVPFLPPFYFAYWIIIIAIIAITHEFAHGIFAAYNKVKTKKTGFGFFPFFLPVFLAAFVELDEKKMVKKSNFGQRAILAAGTFANMATAALFLILLFIFFSLTFAPAGVVFNDYSYTVIDVASITMINGIAVANPNFESLDNLMKDADFNEITANGRDFVGVKSFSQDKTKVALYDDSPAINAKINGAILELNGAKITSLDELSSELTKYNPGDEVTIKTKTKDREMVYEITLGNNPQNPGRAWIGIGFTNVGSSGGFMSKIFATLSSFRESNVYYGSKIGDLGLFIYNLLWWTVIISFSVALVNMLPMGIFDGGRFFYLTILSITKCEKIATNSYKNLSMFFMLVLLLIMIFLAKAVF